MRKHLAASTGRHRGNPFNGDFALRAPAAAGKFLYVGEEKLYVRGVTYGTFRPDEQGREFATPTASPATSRRWRRTGSTPFGTYTVPPRWLLDVAPSTGCA